MGFFKAPQKNTITGTSYIYSLLKMLTDAQQALSHAREQQIDRHIPKDDNGRRVPRLMEIDLGDGTLKRAATYSLARTNSIGLTRATVTCNPRIIDMEMCEHMEDGEDMEHGEMSYKGQHAIFHISPNLAGGANSLNMVLEFEQRSPSETEERIMESLDHFSSEPVRKEKTAPDRKNNKKKTGPFY